MGAIRMEVKGEGVEVGVGHLCLSHLISVKEAASHSFLAERDDVWWGGEVPGFVKPPVTCSSHSCLNFVDYQVDSKLKL